MNNLDILCFTSVARTRSFSIAARELLISQQAVSRHIKVLEDELGFPLFFRNFQNVQLTEAGELMLRYYLERDSFIAAFQKDLLRSREHNTINIGCSQWLGRTSWFARLIDRFSERSPEARTFLHVLTAEETFDFMKRGELDVLFTTRYASRFLPVSWDVREIREEPMFLLSGSQCAFGEDRFAPYEFCGEFAGESDPQSVKVRVRDLCGSLGIDLGGVRVLPDMGSVCVDILLRGGFAFAVNRQTAVDNPDYALFPIERTATSVVCAPFQCANEYVRSLLQLLDEEVDAT